LVNKFSNIIKTDFGENVLLRIIREYQIYYRKKERIEIYLLPKNNTRLLQAISLLNQIYSAGTPFFEMKEETYRYLLGAIEILSKYSNQSIIVNEKGAKLFLYGRDLFKNSVISFDMNMEKNSFVIVKEYSKKPLGMGKLLYATDTFKKIEKSTVVIRNIIDLGYYLRSER